MVPIKVVLLFLMTTSAITSAESTADSFVKKLLEDLFLRYLEYQLKHVVPTDPYRTCDDSQLSQVYNCGLNDLIFNMLTRNPLDLVCVKYTQYSTCLAEFRVPPKCYNSAAWLVNVTASFVCGEGRPGLIEHGRCLFQAKLFSNSTECKKVDVSESKVATQLLMLFNLPQNGSHDAIWAFKQAFQLWCHTWPALGDCLRSMISPQCGQQAALYVQEGLMYSWTNLRPMLQLIEDTDPRMAGTYTCLKNFTGVPGVSPGQAVLWLLNNTATFAQGMVHDIDIFLPIAKAEFGLCGDPTQLLVILKCVFETLIKFGPGPRPQGGITIMEVVNIWCHNGLDQMIKCTVADIALCPGYLASDFQVAMSEMCAAVQGAVVLPRCQSMNIDDIFSDPAISRNCNTTMSLFQTILALVNMMDYRHFNLTEIRILIADSFRDSVCIYNEAQVVVARDIPGLCGPEVAQHFIRALQGVAAFYDKLSKDVWSPTVTIDTDTVGKYEWSKPRAAGNSWWEKRLR